MGNSFICSSGLKVEYVQDLDLGMDLVPLPLEKQQLRKLGLKSAPRGNGKQQGVGRVAKFRQTASCLGNCPILGSQSLVSGRRALSQPIPQGFVLVLFHVHIRGKQDESREKMEVFPTWGGESLTNFIGLYSLEVLAESIEAQGWWDWFNKHKSSPSCSIMSPELLSYTSGASGRGVETDQMLQHLRLMRFKTFFLPLQTYSLLSWAAINRVVLIEEKETKTKNKTRKQKPLPLVNIERLKMIALIDVDRVGRRLAKCTHSSCCPRPGARGRWLQAGYRVGSSLVEPTSHLGYKGRTGLVARPRLAFGQQPCFLKDKTQLGEQAPQGSTPEGVREWLGQGRQVRKRISI